MKRFCTCSTSSACSPPAAGRTAAAGSDVPPALLDVLARGAEVEEHEEAEGGGGDGEEGRERQVLVGEEGGEGAPLPAQGGGGVRGREGRGGGGPAHPRAEEEDIDVGVGQQQAADRLLAVGRTRATSGGEEGGGGGAAATRVTTPLAEHVHLDLEGRIRYWYYMYTANVALAMLVKDLADNATLLLD